MKQNPKKLHEVPADAKRTFTINDNKETGILWVCFVIYLLLLFLGIGNHEPWRDEAQVWLLDRDAGLKELFSLLRLEIHPPLWYLMVLPLVKLGLPYASQNYLCMLVMTVGIYLMLFKTRLPLIIKCVLPFTYFILYEYAFFARNYCLIVFFAATILSVYPQRFNKPWLYALCLIGLFNSHVIMFSFAIGLLLLYILDAYLLKQFNKNTLGAITLIAVNGLLLFYYLGTSKMTNLYSSDTPDVGNNIARAIQEGILIDGNQFLAILLFTVLITALLLRPQLLLLSVMGIVGVFYILAFKYIGAYRHEGALFMIMLITYGLQPHYKIVYASSVSSLLKNNFSILVLIMLLQVKPAIISYVNDIQQPFSGAKDAADFIKERGLQRKIIVGQQAWAVSAILPYLPDTQKAFYSECERYGTYYVYDSCYGKRTWLYSSDYAQNMAYAHFKDKLTEVIMIVNHPMLYDKFVDMIYETPETVLKIDENFYIYKFKDGLK